MDVPKESQYFMTVMCLRFIWDSIYGDWSKVSSDNGLTVTEEQALWVIWLFGSSTVTEVASRLLRDKGTISKSIYALEENGLIIRKAGIDRRSYEFTTTPVGDQVLKKLRAQHGHKSTFSKALAQLTEVEQRTLFTIVIKLAQHIEGENFINQALAQILRIGGTRKDSM